MVVFCPAGPRPVKWTNSRARSSMERRGHATGVAHGPRRVPMTARRRSGPTRPRALPPRCWYRPTCWMVSRPTSQTSRLLRLCRLETSRLRRMAGAPTAPRPRPLEHRNPFLMPEAEAAVMRAPAKRWFSRFGARAVITRLIAWPELLTSARGRASPCHQARSARRGRGERVRCGRHWRRRPHRHTPSFGPLTIDTKRRSNRLTRPAKRHLAAHQAAPSPAISDSTGEGPHQPRRSTPQSPDTCFASHRGCGSLHATADSN